MATPTVPDAPTLITNGSTAEQVVRYLLRYREASTQDIAEGTGISRSASWNALSRLRVAGVVLVVRREPSKTTSGSPAAIWGLEEAYANFEMPERETAQASPTVGLDLVQRALAAQPPLATVWMGALV